MSMRVEFEAITDAQGDLGSRNAYLLGRSRQVERVQGKICVGQRKVNGRQVGK